MSITKNGVVDKSGNGRPVCRKHPSAALSGSFSATGASPAVFIKGRHPVSLLFGEGAVSVERSTDGGDTFQAVKLPDGTTDASFTADAEFDLDVGEEGALIRFNCTSYTSSIQYRIGTVA